jgi:hypothetical protein
MSIEVRCPNPLCAKTLVIPEQYRGHTGRCRFCGAVLTVPICASAQTTAPPAADHAAAGQWSDPVPPSATPLAAPPPAGGGGARASSRGPVEARLHRAGCTGAALGAVSGLPLGGVGGVLLLVIGAVGHLFGVGGEQSALVAALVCMFSMGGLLGLVLGAIGGCYLARWVVRLNALWLTLGAAACLAAAGLVCFIVTRHPPNRQDLNDCFGLCMLAVPAMAFASAGAWLGAIVGAVTARIRAR